MDELLREFLAEAEDLIEALFRDTELLREKQGEGRARRELTGRIFRHVHTIKGTAAAAGLDVAAQVAHEFETLLDGVRLGRVALNDSALACFDETAHALSDILNAAARNETTTLPLSLLENLRRLAENDERQTFQRGSGATLALLPEDLSRTLGADEARRLHEAVSEGQRLCVVNVNFDLETFDQRFRELSAAMSERGELLSTLPGTTDAAPGAISFRLLYATRAGAEELRSLASAFGAASVEELKLEAANEDDEAAGRIGGEESKDETSTQMIAPVATQVRVELAKLDELIAAAHELMTETLAVFEMALEDDKGRAQRVDIEARVAGVHSRFVELEEQLLGLRRVRLARTLERVARAGRRAARNVGKEVDFEISGGEVRLDKSLVEAISDPLLHLVRNAVAHGIETAEERRQAGKSERGAVRLEAQTTGDRVSLKITDDGRGIDLEAIARAGVERGIIEAGRSVTRHQALRLIFRPGFSTAAEVSKMSGRGVGLDVVERAVEQVGGEMHVWSETGQGTTFEMVMPVALALIPALVVSSAGSSYCVDASLASESGSVKAEDIKRAGDEELIDWHGAQLTLVRLRNLLGQPLPPKESAESWPVIIVSPEKETERRTDGRVRARVALLVDELINERAEVLVRRLGAHGLRWTGVSGATELGDGELALVLDLPRLLEDYRT